MTEKQNENSKIELLLYAIVVCFIAAVISVCWWLFGIVGLYVLSMVWISLAIMND